MIFHGSNIEIQKPEIITGKYSKDFGSGFYCTELIDQAIRWAKRFDTPVVIFYNYQPENSLSLLDFTEMSEEWLQFIVDCRAGKKHCYDIVSGPMANDQVYNYISDYINGILTREQFWILARFKHPTHQICFCSEKALRSISFVQSNRYDR